MPETLSKELLGLAGEYAVASELCRRGVYAQLTLGNHKQTDILDETKDHMLRISVKAKQANSWPSVGGLTRSDDFLVLVDLQRTSDKGRPDFYILDLTDWDQLIQKELQRKRGSLLDERNRFIYSDGFIGLNIKPEMVSDALEQWHKIISYIPSSNTT
jgi:hypothetical protein